MSLPDNAALLAELRERLDCLDCLTQSTKRWLIDGFNGDAFPINLLGVYLNQYLTFVEREIASVDHPAFRDVCERMARIEGDKEVLHALGLTPPFEPDVWAWHATRLQLDKPSCPFALANHFAIPYPPDTNADVTSLCLLAEALVILNRPLEGVRLMETPMRLDQDDYAASDLRDRLAKRLHGLEANIAASFVRTNYTRRRMPLENNTATMFIRILARALLTVGRWTESMRLLEAHLWLERSEYETPNLADLLEKRLIRVEPNEAANFVCTLADVLRIANRLKDSMRLLEAHLGLAHDDSVFNLADQLLAREPSGMHRLIATVSSFLWFIRLLGGDDVKRPLSLQGELGVV